MQVNMSVSTEKGEFFITDVFWDRANAEMFGYIKPLFHSKKIECRHIHESQKERQN